MKTLREIEDAHNEVRAAAKEADQRGDVAAADAAYERLLRLPSWLDFVHEAVAALPPELQEERRWRIARIAFEGLPSILGEYAQDLGPENCVVAAEYAQANGYHAAVAAVHYAAYGSTFDCATHAASHPGKTTFNSRRERIIAIAAEELQ